MRRALILCAWILASAAGVFAQEASEEFVVGLYHRPTTDAEARDTLWRHCEEAGVSDLFVQTFYHGFTIYPSNAERTFEQRPEFVGRDLLAEYIEEGHARGIRIHAWLDALLWGPDYEEQPDIPRNQFADTHPEYRVSDADGNTTRQLFVTPANSEVLNLVSLLCIEICHQHPDVDGIHLDQVRYPGGADFTFDASAISRFTGEGNADPRRDQSEDTQNAWREFTAQQLTALVQQVALLMRGLYQGEVAVTAAVYPADSETADDLKRQRWADWLGEDGLDAVVPLCFGTTAQEIAAQMESATEVAEGSRADCWIGLVYRPGTGRPAVEEQMRLLVGEQAQGAIWFNEAWLAEEPESFATIGERAAGRSASSE